MYEAAFSMSEVSLAPLTQATSDCVLWGQEQKVARATVQSRTHGIPPKLRKTIDAEALVNMIIVACKQRQALRIRDNLKLLSWQKITA